MKKVAYLGPSGTFSQAAAEKFFGGETEFIPMESVEEVFSSVLSGVAGHGCVPVENSTEGVVNHTLDTLADSNLQISGEVRIPICQCLAGNCSAEQLTIIYSHAQSLAQCRNYLAVHHPGIPVAAVSSNARAAEMAAANPMAGAIGPERAARLRGLKVLARNIADRRGNATRFLIVGRETPPSSGHDKTSLRIAVHDRVGALYDCLRPFKEAELSLSMIESRPSGERNWEYVFFIDLLGHVSDPPVAAALRTLQNEVASLVILGSYPAAR